MHKDLAEKLNVNLIHSHIEYNGTVSTLLHLLRKKKEVRQGDSPASPTSAATSTHINGVLSPGIAGITKHHSQSNIWPCYLEMNSCVKYVCALTRYA